MFDKVLNSDDFALEESGICVATILAAEHGLNGSVFVERFMRAAGAGQYENATFAYRFDASTGNVDIYVDEPGAYKVTLNQVVN